MQKKIIALAVAGLVSGAAFAQSNVTIYGNLDIGYVQADVDAGNLTTTAAGITTRTRSNSNLHTTGMQDGALSSNYIGFRGSEDLGNGLKANFQLELGLAEADNLGGDTGPDTAGNMSIRKENLGLSGGFGTFTIGRQTILIDDAWAVGTATLKNNAWGDMYTSAVGGGSRGVSLVGTFHDWRANELMTYVSPNFSGFTAAVQYGSGKFDTDARTTTSFVVPVTFGDSNTEHTNWGLRADYANGPFAAVAAYNSEDNKASTLTGTDAVNAAVYGGGHSSKDSWLIGANYNFGIVKIFGQYFDGERNADAASAAVPFGGLINKSDADISGWELGLHIPVNAQITLAGSYFNTDSDTKVYTAANAVSGVAQHGNGDGSGYQLAALYSMSKRTTAYAMYGHEDADWSAHNYNTGTGAYISSQKASADVDVFGIGLKHTF
jgi:predicted porin